MAAGPCCFLSSSDGLPPAAVSLSRRGSLSVGHTRRGAVASRRTVTARVHTHTHTSEHARPLARARACARAKSRAWQCRDSWLLDDGREASRNERTKRRFAMTLGGRHARRSAWDCARWRESDAVHVGNTPNEMRRKRARRAPPAAVAATARVNSALLRRGGGGRGGAARGAGTLAYRAAYAPPRSAEGAGGRKRGGRGSGNGDGQGRKKPGERERGRGRERARRWRPAGKGRHLKSASGQVRECRHIRYSGWRCTGPRVCACLPARLHACARACDRSSPASVRTSTGWSESSVT